MELVPHAIPMVPVTFQKIVEKVMKADDRRYQGENFRYVSVLHQGCHAYT